ncbi:MAG: ABC transporter substrate-binding protein [Gordonia sp. (in: high G+C Gram-positive bacteria)]
MAAATIPFVITAMALAGCSSVSGGTDSGTKTLTLGIGRGIVSIDPWRLGSPGSDGSLQGALYVGLTSIDPQGKTIPALAEDWRKIDDLTWRFELRPDTKFSDGSALTASDVAWNFQSILAPDSKSNRHTDLRSYTTSVTADGERGIVFHLSAPARDLPSRLWNYYIVKPDFAKQHATLSTAALGAGPYTLDSIDLDNGAKLTKNPHYFGPAPAYDKVNYRVVPTEAARIAALKSGEISATVNLDINDLRQFSDTTQWRVTNSSGSWTNHLLINEDAGNPALKDVRVRQALNYGIDKTTITKNILGGTVSPSPGQALSAPWDPVNPTLSAYPYDPDRARKLLAAAGYGNGLSLELAVPSGTYVSSAQTTAAIVEQLQRIGVHITLTETPFPVWAPRTQTLKAADLTYRGALGYYKNDLQVIRYYLPTGSVQIHIPKSQADTDYAAAVKSTTAEEQQSLVNSITQQQFDSASFVFLWPQPATSVSTTKVNWNIRPNLLLWPQDFSPH